MSIRASKKIRRVANWEANYMKIPVNQMHSNEYSLLEQKVGLFRYVYISIMQAYPQVGSRNIEAT